VQCAPLEDEYMCPDDLVFSFLVLVMASYTFVDMCGMKHDQSAAVYDNQAEFCFVAWLYKKRQQQQIT